MLDSGGFPRELPYRRPFLSLVSPLLSFSFSFFSVFQHFNFSFVKLGSKKKGVSFIFILVGFAARLSVALLVEPSC